MLGKLYAYLPLKSLLVVCFQDRRWGNLQKAARFCKQPSALGAWSVPLPPSPDSCKSLGRISPGHPGGYPGGRPGARTFSPSLGVQENEVFCADVLDPKVRADVHDPRGLREELYARKLRADFSFPSGLARVFL